MATTDGLYERASLFQIPKLLSREIEIEERSERECVRWGIMPIHLSGGNKNKSAMAL